MATWNTARQSVDRTDAALGEGVISALHVSGLPLILRPAEPSLGSDMDAFITWFRAAKPTLDQLAAQHGAILLRGFPLRESTDFARAIDHYPSENLSYVGGVAPRGQIAERVFESTRALKAWELVLHQEMAYLPHFPRMIAFFSRRSAWAGGETVLADFRQLKARLPPRIWDAVRARGVRYERNFRKPGPAEEWRGLLHKTWPDAFGADDPALAEDACRSVGLEPVWRDDGSLSTLFTAPGFIDHPLTGETVWFNHIASQTMNARTLRDTWPAYEAYYRDGRIGPFQVTYGDGGAIATEDVEAIYEAFEGMLQSFRWRDGDLLLVDNVMTAHGRYPYEGERDLQVALLG